MCGRLIEGSAGGGAAADAGSLSPRVVSLNQLTPPAL